MKLKLDLKGDITPFSSFLKTFAKVRSSLLLEIDTNQKAFISKVFSEDRASVLYSAISFEDCNMTVVSHDGEKELGKNRIKAGILIQLPKFIKIVERLGADHFRGCEKLMLPDISFGPTLSLSQISTSPV